MQVNIKKLSDAQVEFEVEISADEFNGFIEQAVVKLKAGLEIKGFRKGKVPVDVLEREVGEEKILIEAASLAIKEGYEKVVAENKLEVISQPEIKITKMARQNPFVFVVKMVVMPKIKLPDYKKIAAAVERKKVTVSEKEIEDALKWLQKSRAKFKAQQKPAEKGDFVEIEYWLFQSGDIQDTTIPHKDAFVLGEGGFMAGFEDSLIGMKPGEVRQDIWVAVPESQYMNFQSGKMEGKKIKAKVKLNSVQSIEIPALNDQFAQNLGNFQDLAALKKSIADGLLAEKNQAESQRLRNEILEKISQATDCEIPEILVKQEQNQMMLNLKRSIVHNASISRDNNKGSFGGPTKSEDALFAEYLKKVRKTEKELLDSFRSQARKNIKNFLVLREIGKEEHITISESEVQEEANKLLKRYSTAQEAQKDLDPEQLKNYTKEVIRNNKIFQLLEGSV